MNIKPSHSLTCIKMTILRISAPILSFLALHASAGDELLVFGQIPDQFMCINFRHSYCIQDLGRSLTTHTYQAVDKGKWRTEHVDESGKGVTITFDGSQIRSSSKSFSKKSPEEIETLNPKVWFPRFLKSLQDCKVIKSAPSTLEGMQCTRYSIIDSEKGNLEVWLHDETRMLIQMISRTADQTVHVDRYLWVSGQKAADCVLPEIVSQEMHRIFASKINQNIRTFESVK